MLFGVNIIENAKFRINVMIYVYDPQDLQAIIRQWQESHTFVETLRIIIS